MKNILLVVSLLMLCVSQQLWAQVQETGFLNRSVAVNGVTRDYQVYLPRNYSMRNDWPVILFLHGAGERGDDGMAPSHVGLGRAIRFNPERWPAIAVFPQAPEESMWQGSTADIAIAALDATLAEFSIDEDRQYLTGLSLGGNGTWYVGYNHGERFAAMLAICGFVQIEGRRGPFIDGGNPYLSLAERISDKPVWIVHGDADVVVPVDESRRMAEALNQVGAEVHYTELPGVNHNSWDPAYRDVAIIDWLFSKSL